MQGVHLKWGSFMWGFARAFNRLSDLVQKVFLLIAGIVLIGMVVLTALAVYYRYVLRSSLAWSEEMDCYLFVWLTCLGAAIGYKFKAHPQVVIVVDHLPGSLKKIITSLADLVVFVLGAILILYGGKMIALMGTETASTVPISMIYPYLAIPVGSFGLCIHSINHILNVIYPSGRQGSKEADAWQHSA